MTIIQILQEPTEKVVEWAIREYFTPINIEINSVGDLENLSKQLPLLVNQYSYLASVLSYLKFSKRAEKDKIRKSTLIDKEEIMQRALDTVKLKYQSISRAITIRQEINKELDMSRYI